MGCIFSSSLDDLLFCGQPEVDLPANGAVRLEPEMIGESANFLNLRLGHGDLGLVHGLVVVRGMFAAGFMSD